ncbi:hypothetical protein PLICRDRAFT_132526 [Plicaturopsis crispa FD-325 SS-3]|nr:hypothetical protein PLICRDRAFT_132526 [Plicaturopsis crispa FD-325 SS-3]
MSGKVFNVDVPAGADLVKNQTTAADARLNAPSTAASNEVERTAEKTHDVGEQAARAAASLGPALTGEPPSAFDKLHAQASATTNAAVNEGHHDVDAAKASGGTYLDQAKSLAGNALTTAQGYLASAQTAAQPHVDNARTTIQPHVDAARTTLQPHIDSAKAAVQPQLDRAKEAAQGYIGGPNPTHSETTGHVAATSAPLESGHNTSSTPYPATTQTGTAFGS